MLKSTLTVLTNMSYGCNDNLYRPQSTRTQHLKKVFTHPAKANLRPEYRARIQLKRAQFGLFSMFRYSPLPLTSDWIFSLGPNWTSWESADFSIHTAVPTDLLEEVKIFPVQQEAPTDSLEKVLILFRSETDRQTLNKHTDLLRKWWFFVRDTVSSFTGGPNWPFRCLDCCIDP